MIYVNIYLYWLLGFCNKNSKISKSNDIKIAYYIATRTSIRCVDHLTDLLNNLSNCKCEKLRIDMKRTKCTNIIKNVIGSALLEDLVDDIGDSLYNNR